MREVTCERYLINFVVTHSRFIELTQVVHVRNDIRQILLQIHETILRLLIIVILRVPLVQSSLSNNDLRCVRSVLRRRGRRRMSTRGSRVGNQHLDLVLVRRDLLRKLNDLGLLESTDLVELSLERLDKVRFVRVVPFVELLPVLDEPLEPRVCDPVNPIVSYNSRSCSEPLQATVERRMDRYSERTFGERDEGMDAPASRRANELVGLTVDVVLLPVLV